MDNERYQRFCDGLAEYPGKGTGTYEEMSYLALGLGEAGEVQGLVKKWHRDARDDDEVREKVKKELGDLLWYATQSCTAWGFTLSEVMEANIKKLNARKRAGQLSGEGRNELGDNPND